MPKIRITKRDGSVKVTEGNRNILGALNSYSLSTGKPVDIKKHFCILFLQYLKSILNSDGSRGHTAKRKLKNISLQDLEDQEDQGLFKNKLL